MAFWLDRFRKDDEEDIWEELKQMLLEQPSDQEIALKNQQEQSKIDAALERMFPDLPKQQSEPYLNYEDLFGGKRQAFDGPTGMAAPIQETPLTYRKSLSPYEEIDLKEGWSDELKAQKKEEVARIQKEAAEREWDINVENALEHGKNWTGAALEIGSAAVPGYGGAKLAGTLAKKLAPKLGRKIAQEIATGTLKGASAGTVEGLGRGLREDENPLKTAAQDTLTGAVLGSAGGAAGGKIQHEVRKKNLEELVDKRKDWGIAFTKQSGKPEEAIDKLLEQKQGFVPKATKKRGIGDIDFVWGNGGKKGYGISHIVDQRNNDGLDGVQFARQVPNIISSGKIEKISNQPNIDFIRSGEDSALVKKVWDDKRRTWIVTSFKDKESLNKSINRTPDIVNNENGMAPPLNLNKDNNIIMPLQNNLNPNQQPIPKSMSYEEWLEEEKRKRKKRGWW